VTHNSVTRGHSLAVIVSGEIVDERLSFFFLTDLKLKLNATDLKDDREVETAYKKGHELI
jgi:hypothetical protein